MDVPSAKHSRNSFSNTNHQKRHNRLVDDGISRMAIKLPTAFTSGILAKAVHSAKAANNVYFRSNTYDKDFVLPGVPHLFSLSLLSTTWGVNLGRRSTC